jgi:hypothetical protein
MWLLFILSKAEKLDINQLDVLREIIRNKGKHWAPRGAAVLALGKLGDDADKTWLRGLYSDEVSDYIKRAIVISAHNFPPSARNKFYNEIRNDSPGMERLVNYLKQDKIETI